MRLPIQITKDQFGGDVYPLGIAGLADEFERSWVYNAATKKDTSRDSGPMDRT